jgi:TolA-binding protein/thioredoxin-like negative regulator of GroEL
MKTFNSESFREQAVQRSTFNVQRQSGGLVLVLVLVLVIALVPVGRDRARAEGSADLKSAIQPMAEGIPEVSIVRLESLLSLELSEDDRRAASVSLAEAHIAAGEAGEAIPILDRPLLRGFSAADFWRAQALATLGRWEEALPFYEAVAAKPQGPFRAEALFGKAEALRSIGRVDEALQAFALLFPDELWKTRTQLRSVEMLLEKKDAAAANHILDEMQPASTAEKKERRFLRGRLEAQLNHPGRAVELLRTIPKEPTDISHSMLMAALFALADAHLQLRSPDAADDALQEFIERNPNDRDLPKLFAKLDQVYQSERKPSRSDLSRWIRDPAQPRRSLAQWYLARLELRAGNRDVALRIFGDLVKKRATFPAVAEAYLDFAQLQIDDRRFDEARATLVAARLLHPEARISERIEWLSAETDYQMKKFAAAGAGFERLGHSALGSGAIFNASLSWLQLGDNTRFLTNDQALSKGGQNEQARAELRLEQGLMQAAQGDGRAAASLQSFLRDFPQDKRASEAWVALAEVAFHAAPPRLEEARKNLAQAMESQPTPAAIERGDYLALWIEEAAPKPDDGKVITLATEFLRKHEQSRFASDVRMKLAETYFQRQDFPSAQTQFEILTRQEPNGPYAEKAFFFAGQAAMSSMGANSLSRALELFDQVARKDGQLKWAARNEQAAIERKLGKPQDALPLYEEVLKNSGATSVKREALCGKADIFFEMGATQNENYQRAIELYDQLAADPKAPSHWRNQALFKKGVCLEKMNKRPDALATFYQVVEDEVRPDRPREFFWFYKAGFNAARLLEDDAKWRPAAAIYEKLAAVGGARSEEAKSRLARLRLEHFLWDE